MKKIWIVLLILLMASNGYCVDEFAKLEPLGSRAGADLDSYLNVNFEAQDRLMFYYRRGLVAVADSASQIKVLAGEIAIPNAGGTVVRYRKNTSTVTVTFSDLDTGSEAASTQYYVYSVGDTASTAATFKISTSSTAPTGITYYKKIAYFYNNSSSNIVNVGNIKNSDAPNIMSVTGATDITTTSSSYEDMTDMEMKFVSNGRPVKISFQAQIRLGASNSTSVVVLDIDGTDKIASAHRLETTSEADASAPLSLLWLETLTAGTHTIKVQWKIDGNTAYQDGTTYKRILIVSEL